MKKIDGLELVRQPAPRERKICVACVAFAAECLVPVGEGALPMCWICAHHVVEHATPLHEVLEARCGCTSEEIYPTTISNALRASTPVAAIRVNRVPCKTS